MRDQISRNPPPGGKTHPSSERGTSGGTSRVPQPGQNGARVHAVGSPGHCSGCARAGPGALPAALAGPGARHGAARAGALQGPAQRLRAAPPHVPGAVHGQSHVRCVSIVGESQCLLTPLHYSLVTFESIIRFRISIFCRYLKVLIKIL